MLLLSPLIMACAAASPAQVVGGDFEVFRNFDGPVSWEGFGYSCAGAGDVNGDGIPDVIIGSYIEDVGGLNDVGTVDVFSGANGNLLHHWEGVDEGGIFGVAVAGVGDINLDGYDDVIVGAQYEDNGATSFAGAAYVYSGFDGTQIHKFVGEYSYAYFGGAVASAGYVDADNTPDIIIGSWNANNGSFYDYGAAYIYSGSSGSLIRKFSGTTHNSRFGNSVAGVGDVNGDGIDDQLVGIPFEYLTGAGYGGRAILYSGADGSVIHQWDGYPDGSTLGWSVSAADDLNNDGVNDVVISSAYANIGPKTQAGRVHVYSGADASLIHKWDGETRIDVFGSSVAGVGDMDGDGVGEVVVGAYNADRNGTDDEGAVYIYSGATGAPIYRQLGNSDDILGHAVAALGDLDQDGHDEVLVSALGADTFGGNRAGRVSVIRFTPILYPSSEFVSASAGGIIQFNLDFPAAYGGLAYEVLISASGVGPTHYGVDIPLTLDSLVMNTHAGIYPVMHHAMHGTLAKGGNGFASISVPAGLDASLIGNTYYLAAIAGSPGLAPQVSSISRTLTIIP